MNEPEIELGKYLERELEIFVASFPDIFSFVPRLSLDSPCMLSKLHSLHGIVPNKMKNQVKMTSLALGFYLIKYTRLVDKGKKFSSSFNMNLL